MRLVPPASRTVTPAIFQRVTALELSVSVGCPLERFCNVECIFGQHLGMLLSMDLYTGSN